MPPSPPPDAVPAAASPGDLPRWSRIAFLILAAALIIALITGMFLCSGGFIPPPLEVAGTPPSGIPSPMLPTTPLVTAPTTQPTPEPPVAKLPVTVWVTPVPSPVPGVESYPAIREESGSGTIVRSYRFPFRDRNISVTAGTLRAVYDGAKNGRKAAVTSRRDIDKALVMPGYFLSFVNDPKQDAFFTNLTASLRTVRQELQLDDDGYFELMVVFVQSLDYDTAGARDEEGDTRFPAETFVDGKGVCGDKSLLLAGLASREGYDVSLLLFTPEKHMALGIRSGGNQYRNTTYAYVETTRLSYVGAVPERLSDGTVLRSFPQVIPVGNGWRRYSAGNQTAYLAGQAREAEQRILQLESRLKEPGANESLTSDRIGEHNRYVLLYNFIREHEYDRPGAFAYSKTHAITPPEFPGAETAPPLQTPAYLSCGGTGDRACPPGTRCCSADFTCYTWCTQGSWDPVLCACRSDRG